MRIRHVIPTVGPEASDALCAAQKMTLASVDRALRAADPGLQIEVRAVHYPDEPCDSHPWLTATPALKRSILDFGDFDTPRRLPLLADVLAAFDGGDEYDIGVLTNVDIALHPLFYDLVRDTRSDGYDAFSITRRTVQARFGGSTLAQLATTRSSPHPGHDCFAMTPELVLKADVGNVALGVRWVARTLLWNLKLNARRFENFADLHATFHIGDDRIWADPRLKAFDEHNEREAHGVVERLCARHGEERVERLAGARPFVRAMRKNASPVIKPAKWRVFSPQDPPHPQDPPYASGSHQLIFSANPGRSGSQYLAELLGESPNVIAGHEKEPAMTGGWLRDVVHRGPGPSRELRRIKADTVRAELAGLADSTRYADTSHMFVKTFADVIFDEFPHHLVSVVVLRRDPISVARSFFELDYMGLTNAPWPDFMPPPTAPASMFHIPADEIRSRFDLIFGYLIDFEIRSQTLREQAPSARWIDTRLEEITTVEGATRLFDRLRVPTPPQLAEIVNRKVNVKQKRKATINQPTTLVAVERAWSDFLNRFGHRDEVGAYAELHGLATGS